MTPNQQRRVGRRTQMFAARRNESEEVAAAIDSMVEADYRENL